MHLLQLTATLLLMIAIGPYQIRGQSSAELVTLQTSVQKLSDQVSQLNSCSCKGEAVTNLCKPVLMQQHYGGSAYFRRNWTDYKAGFGQEKGDYWIGNDRLYQLTKDNRYVLRIDIMAKETSEWFWAEYSTFMVDSEANGYKLTVSGYTGTAADNMGYVNGFKFSTPDRDNDNHPQNINCAAHPNHYGGFWYRDCGYAHVNSPIEGLYGFTWFRLPYCPSTYESWSTRCKLLYSRMTLILKP